jgi:hypothetical protein
MSLDVVLYLLVTPFTQFTIRIYVRTKMLLGTYKCGCGFVCDGKQVCPVILAGMDRWKNYHIITFPGQSLSKTLEEAMDLSQDRLILELLNMPGYPLTR